MATSSKKQELSNNNYIIVVSLVTLVVLGVTGLGVKVLLGDIVRDAKVLKAKNAAVSQLEKNLETAPKLVENYKNLGSTNQLIMDALPNTADFPGLIAMMDNLSREAGVSLKSVSPGASAVALGGVATASSSSKTGDVPTPQTYAFSATFDGTFASFQTLIANLEASARPVKVSSLQLSGSGNSLSVQMEGVTYYQDKASMPIKMEPVK